MLSATSFFIYILFPLTEMEIVNWPWQDGHGEMAAPGWPQQDVHGEFTVAR